METPATATVTASESRAKRQERSQARFRDRGGIFVPSQRNDLLDILLGNSRPKSPPRRSRSRSGSLSPQKNKAPAKVKTPGKSKGESVKSRRKSLAKPKRKSVAISALPDILEEGEEEEEVVHPRPTAKAARKGKASSSKTTLDKNIPTDPVDKAKPKPSTSRKPTKSKTKAAAVNDEDAVPPPKTKSKAAKPRPKSTVDDDAAPAKQPKKSRALTKAALAKAKAKAEADGDNDDDAPVKKPAKQKATARKRVKDSEPEVVAESTKMASNVTAASKAPTKRKAAEADMDNGGDVPVKKSRTTAASKAKRKNIDETEDIVEPKAKGKAKVAEKHDKVHGDDTDDITPPKRKGKPKVAGSLPATDDAVHAPASRKAKTEVKPVSDVNTIKAKPKVVISSLKRERDTIGDVATEGPTAKKLKKLAVVKPTAASSKLKENVIKSQTCTKPRSSAKPKKPASKVRGLPKVIRDLLKNSALAPHDQDGEPDEIDFLS